LSTPESPQIAGPVPLSRHNIDFGLFYSLIGAQTKINGAIWADWET
jgi:hypothetical protein